MVSLMVDRNMSLRVMNGDVLCQSFFGRDEHKQNDDSDSSEVIHLLACLKKGLSLSSPWFPKYLRTI